MPQVGARTTIVVSTHWADISPLICSTLASGDWVPINGDGIEVQFLFATKKHAESNGAITVGIQQPLLSYPATLCRAPVVGVGGTPIGHCHCLCMGRSSKPN